ncbi:MAG: hypothetical protein ABJA60_04750 [Nitrosospira sp.]
MTLATNINNTAKEFPDMEVARIRHLDSLLLNDVKRIRNGRRILYIPLIIFAVLIVLAKLTQRIDANSYQFLVFPLFLLLLIVAPTKIRIYKNLKLFNESKATLERAGLRLWRRGERNLHNPADDLIEVVSNVSDNKTMFNLLPLQDIDLNNYKKTLSDI